MSIIEQALKRLQGSDEDSAVFQEAVPAFGKLLDRPHHVETNGRVAHAVPRRVVQLDREALVSSGYLPPVEFQRRMADQFRHAKRPLLDSALGRGTEPLMDGSRIMVTSSVPNEGKTFVSFNLAVSMAQERDLSIVLIDADVAKRHISQLFGVDKEPGLLDAIQNENCDIDSLILATSFQNLHVLPAGRPADTATELLTGHRMESVVAKLSVGFDRRRILIFDSPPLLLTSESRALTRHVGQIVLVVRAESTPQQVVDDAITCAGRERPIRLLLNQCESTVEPGYYYHDGAYGKYGGYAARGASEVKR
jgi:exopolysaccharide/PEP-CTERM locus tyrosine autokinase